MDSGKKLPGENFESVVIFLTVIDKEIKLPESIILCGFSGNYLSVFLT